MERKKFLWKDRGNSFVYAWSGLRALLRNEHNSRIHLVMTVAAIAACIILKVSTMEAGIITIAMGLVWITEIINTAIEKTMDLISKELHPQIKLVKDLAAAAVLLSAVTAVIAGCLVFIPKII